MKCILYFGLVFAFIEEETNKYCLWEVNLTFYIKMFRLMCQSANLVRKIAVYCHPMEEIVEWVRKLWTESHQICKVWALINQILTWCFRSYGLWLKIQIIAQFNISKSIDINQSISIHQFYPIDASNFIRDYFVFP